MCGIAGITLLKSQDERLVPALLEMSRRLSHRGPDDEGFFLSEGEENVFFAGHSTPDSVRYAALPYTSEEILAETNKKFSLGFCHRRLSILDLSPRGHQPMCDSERKIFITYNGEIYNYRELRHSLESKGFTFFSETDTEVIINSYKYWGSDCLGMFNGMWSFVLYDAEKKELFAARDRFGVKPLYYYHDDKSFCFASEIKALSGLPFVNTEINYQAVCDFLLNNELEYESEGLFKNILELFPSQFLKLDLRSMQLKVSRYYSLKIENETLSTDDWDEKKITEEISARLESAVRIRLRADVPVGACLSGGIDSSVISGILQKELLPYGNTPDFFSVVFPGDSADESVWAKELVKQGGNWHCVEPRADELWRDLDELIYAQDTPLWSSSTYAQHRVMRLAREKNIKVLLDGQGGDELFAGYHPHYLSFWNELKRMGKGLERTREIKQFSGAKKFLWKEFIKDKLDHSGFLALKKIKDPSLHFLRNDFLATFQRSPKTHRYYDELNQHLQAEFCDTRLKLYLKCEDRCSMWHSVESRTPFADDIRLIEFVFGLPGYLKIRDGVSKSLLREAGKAFIPEKIYRRRDKMGYLTPHNRWMRDLKAKWISEDFSAVAEFLDVRKFESIRAQLFSPAGNGEHFLAFKLITLNRWRKLFNI